MSTELIDATPCLRKLNGHGLSMPKKKKKTELDDDVEITPEYTKYLDDHKKRLKRLQRELSGDNMESPPDYGY